MAKENKCPHCDANLPSTAPRGLCPQCLMEAGLAENADITLDESPASESPGTKIGRYELLEQIGEGGMGLVYLARQQEPKRKVALKIVKLGMDTRQVVARFEAERQTLALLTHPNIAHVFDAGTTETGRPYFVMEYVEGRSITKYCDEQKLSVEQRLELFQQVCEGVHHAHQKGIIHRDLKPSNILVSVHGDRAVPKIIDFGIAKAITQPLTENTSFTEHGQLLGTPEYMSPEQAEMAYQDVDTRSDIYSLGVLLYELLAGATPFDAERLRKGGIDHVQHVICEEEPCTPSARLTSLGDKAEAIAQRRRTQIITLTRRLHRELEWIPMKAMRKDRSRRYRSASELSDDIQNYLTGTPLLAGPESNIYRARKFVHKHAGFVASAALVAVVIVIGLITSTAFSISAEKARGEEAAARTQAEQARNHAEEQSEKYRNLFYVHSVAMADVKYRERSLPSARKLLDLCPEDLRGWEWYRLDYVLDEVHTDANEIINSYWACATSPNGARIATAYRNGTIKIWDGATGNEILNFRGHEAPIYTVEFSPDGRLIISGGEDQLVKVWDVASGKNVVTLRGHDSWIKCATFSPDGKRIASASGKYTGSTMAQPDAQTASIKIWDANSGEELITIHDVAKRIDSVSFHPEGKRILTGHASSEAFEWDTSTGKKLRTFSVPGQKILPTKYTHDGRQVIVGCENGTIKIFDIEMGNEIVTSGRHSDGVTRIIISPDGKRIASASHDHTIKIWDSLTGEELSTLGNHIWNFIDVAFNPVGELMVTANFSGKFKIWDENKDREFTILEGHEDLVYDVVFSPDSQWLASTGKDKTIKLWDVTENNEIRTLSGHEGTVHSIVFNSDGRRIVSGSTDKTVRIWNVETGKQLMSLNGHEDKVISVSINEDDTRIISGSHDKTVRAWNALTGEQLMIFSGHNANVCSVAFSPNGRKVVSGAWDGELKIWETSTGVELMSIVGHEDIVRTLLFTADGKRIVSGSYDHTVKIWDAENGNKLMVLIGHNGPIEEVDLSPDGKRIVSASVDGTVKVWDMETGSELMTLPAEQGAFGIAFSPNGRMITGACGPRKGNIIIWNSAPVPRIREDTGKHNKEPSSVTIVPVMDRNSTDDTTVSDLDRLQGTWVGNELGQGGEVKWTLSGNRVHYVLGQAWHKGTFVLNEESSPKQADFTIKESFMAEFVGQTAKCIYELKNTSLKLAGSHPGVETRPSDFEPSDYGFVFQLKRQPSNQE
ncbi:protein kinase [Planctomycetota bacterium]